MSARALVSIVVLGAFLLILGVGCAPSVEEIEIEKEVARPEPVMEKTAVEPATLALKFTKGEFGKYRSVTEMRKDYKFEQPAKGESKEEQSQTRTEIAFSQRITHLGEDGSAIAAITIQGLKCYSAISQDVRMDFNSYREGSGSEPLAELLGQSYLIRIYPDGTVKFVDAAKARTAVREGLAARFASGILSDGMIELRHSVPAMKGRSESPARKGQQWSVIEEGPKGMLQSKEYDKNYKLVEIREQKGRQIAVVQMQAKAVEKVGEEGEVMDFFKQLFKGVDSYVGEGELLFNLDTGKVEKFSEELKASWTATDPEYADESGSGPDMLLMGFTQSRSLEKLY